MEILLVFPQIMIILQISLLWSLQIGGGEGKYLAVFACVLCCREADARAALPSRSGRNSSWSILHVISWMLYINMHNSMMPFSGGGGLSIVLHAHVNLSLCCSTCVAPSIQSSSAPSSAIQWQQHYQQGLLSVGGRGWGHSSCCFLENIPAGSQHQTPIQGGLLQQFLCNWLFSPVWITCNATVFWAKS